MNQSYLEIIPRNIKTAELHSYLLSVIAPRPIAFASTINKKGEINLSPFSFFNVFSANPPIVIFSPSRRVRDNSGKDTLRNVMEIPEVCINVVNYELTWQMNLASNEYPTGTNEFIKSGLNSIPSHLIKPPRVQDSPAQIECKVKEIKPLSAQAGAGNLIICEVVCLHINKQILGEDGKVDPSKIDLVARMGGDWYCRAASPHLFQVEKPSRIPGIGIDVLPAEIKNSPWLSGKYLGMLGNTESLPIISEIAEFKQNRLPDLIKQNQISGNAKSESQFIQEEIINYLNAGQKSNAWLLLCAYYDFYWERN